MNSTPIPSPPAEVDIAIVGCGIGGLAAAVALRRAGFDAHVFERAPVLSEVGGAVAVREPSVRLLEQWGLDRFHEEAVPTRLLELHDRTGTLLNAASMDFVGDGRSWFTHRADVHDLLRAAVPAGHIHLDRAASTVTNEQDGQRARVSFGDGTEVSARLVVGADGIRSVTRRAIHDDDPHFQGTIVTRGLAPASELPSGMPNDRARFWADGDRTILTTPLRGGRMIAVDTILSNDLPPEDLWHAEIGVDELLDRYGDFDPVPVRLIAAGTVPVRANPVYDREPVETWADGRIALLGDAAHPMAPRQGQGANQAIQDAGALADALAGTGLGDVPGALRAYQDARVGPATALQRLSRQVPEQYDARRHPAPAAPGPRS